MKVGLVTVAFNEERLIKPFLKHLPKWIDEVLVLVSSVPWQGDYEEPDQTAKIARDMGAEVVSYNWQTEEDQRNAGQDWNMDKDWVIVLDPDEFLDDQTWIRLHKLLKTSEADALIVEGQHTYWKNGYVADPPRDYPQLIAARPYVDFIDKRVVDQPYEVAAGIWIHHMSWARTDAEVWSKISHYAHAKDFDIKSWYENVWLKWKPGTQDVHPTSPDTLHDLVPAKLPKELEELQLWPPG